jgi:carbon storage regulator
MLVISRNVGEEIVMFGPGLAQSVEKIVVRISSVRGDKVRVAVDAPMSLSVHRREVYERIRSEHAAAAGLGVRR